MTTNKGTEHLHFVKSYLLYGILLTVALTSRIHAQGLTEVTDKPLRLEFNVGSDKETYRIIPCQRAGMILFYQSVETTQDQSTRWYFLYYDQHLQQVWIKNVPIHSSLEYKSANVIHDTVAIFFESGKKAKSGEINFQILRIVLSTGSLILNNGKAPVTSSPVSFNVIGQTAYIGLNDTEEQAQILIMDLPTGKTSLVSLMEGEKTKLEYVSADSALSEITALVTQQVSKRISELFLVKCHLNGVKKSETHISNYNSLKHLNAFRTLPVSGNISLIAGSYVQTPAARRGTKEEVTGIFASEVVTTFQSSIHFYNFLDLKNIRQLLSDRDILSLRKKSMKKNRSDQEYSLDFSLLLHDIIPWNDQFILAAETYFPQFHTEAFTDYDFYGRPFTNTYSVFDGYRFTGIILTAFDKEGKLLWDNAMGIRDILSFSLEPKVTVFGTGNEIILAYLSEGRIASRIIRESETIEKTTYSRLELMNENEKLIKESNGRMIHWYGNYFLCYGYQEIRDISKGSNDKRLVFFCNKIRFDR